MNVWTPSAVPKGAKLPVFVVSLSDSPQTANDIATKFELPYHLALASAAAFTSPFAFAGAFPVAFAAAFPAPFCVPPTAPFPFLFVSS